MARGGVDPIVRYAVLSAVGFVGWNWASVQPTSSPFRQSVDQVRGWFKQHPAGPAAPAPARSPAASAPAPAAPPSAAPAPGATQVDQYNQLDADGNWYQVTAWSDGTYTSSLIPPSLWAQYGIPTGGAGGADEGPPQTWTAVQKHDDGQWWVDSGYTDPDGSSVLTSSQPVDPSNYQAYGILPDGSGKSPFAYLAP